MTTYLDELEPAFREAYKFAFELACDLTREDTELHRSTFQSIFWECVHDLLIRSRRANKEQEVYG